MKNKIENIVFLILVAFVFIFTILKLNHILNIKKLVADINYTDTNVGDNIKYNLGDLVYFDPVSTNKCDETTFNLDAVINGTSTCYKWRVMEVNDNTTAQNISLQMDHNLVLEIGWDEYHDGDVKVDRGPKVALSSLAEATANWERVPLLNYTYDSSHSNTVRYNYGTLTCTNGTCINGNNFTLATNVRARLVTFEELEKITKSILPSINENYASSYDDEFTWVNKFVPGFMISASSGCAIYSNLNSTDNCANTNPTLASSNLSWLLENTNEHTISLATTNVYGNRSFGYWTMTPSPISSFDNYGCKAYGVDWGGKTYDYNNHQLRYGARPYINISKDLLQDKVTVTYNDEERITTTKIISGSKAQSIPSQGKEGYTFKYWSLEQNGQQYNFDTIVDDDITLYAVYEINKYDIEFYDDNILKSTIQVDYNNSISPESIPTVSKEGYIFKYWSENEEEFDFTTKIKKNYKLYSKYEKEQEDEEEPKVECILSIESNKYKVDNINLTISNVPEKETNEEIEKNLIINSNNYKITDDKVIITCGNETKEYKIVRTWIPQTGQIVIRYLPIIGYISIIIVLLIVINKQRLINERLRKM